MQQIRMPACKRQFIECGLPYNAGLQTSEVKPALCMSVERDPSHQERVELPHDLLQTDAVRHSIT